MGTYHIRCGFMFPLPIALTLHQVAHATSGQTLGGRWGLWPFLAKQPKFTQEWLHKKLHLRFPRGTGLGPLHGSKPKPCVPFATRVRVQVVREAFLTPQSLKHTKYGKKCIYRRYWRAYIHGPLRNKNLSKLLMGGPNVSVFKYALLGLGCPRPPMSLACAYERVCKEAVWHACSQGDAI